MIHAILSTLYFFAPAMLGNGLIPVRQHIPLLKKGKHAIDCGLTFRGRRIFGENKTIEGYVFGTVIALIAGLIQSFLHRYEFFRNYELLDFSKYSFVLIGGVQGFVAIFGDSLKSFVKRQFDVKPGKPFLFFDQTDIVFTSIIFSAFFYPVPLSSYIILLVGYPIIHQVFHMLAYVLKIRDSWI
ncbi:CDP-archaeol synthase [Candidatus Dojkabacteria bacterium]|nr:CDP-archaeol synthase [Candidatus Dojkabacteria bacterium]